MVITDSRTGMQEMSRDECVRFLVEHQVPARYGWSVVVAGHAKVVTDESLIMLLGSSGLEPFAAGRKRRWVAIEPVSITGRRVPAPGGWFG